MDLRLAAAGMIPMSMLVAGFVLIWVSMRLPRNWNGELSHVLISVRVSGWILFTLGLFVLVGAMTHALILVAWPATAIVLAAAVHQYFDAERRSLLWLLTTAAERGIPLDTAARAFADERNDRVGRRAARLADYLEAGIPLGLALQRSGNSVSHDVRLAASLGQQTGTLGPAMRQVSSHSAIFEKTIRTTAHWIFYLSFLVFYMFVALSFSITKIFPTLQAIYHDFDVPLPVPSERFESFINQLNQNWYLWGTFILGLLVFVFLVLIHYIGFSIRQLPLFRRLWWRVDCALIMRWLATAVRRNRPISEMLHLLSGYFPQPVIRRRLERVTNRIEHGHEWCDSLRQAGLVSRSESVLFKAAERAGNLSWVLDEMADSAVRRSAYRLRIAVDFAFPLILLVLGCVELCIALALFMPVFSLIGRF